LSVLLTECEHANMLCKEIKIG